MDMNTIKALQAANAGILLTLTREPVRTIFEQWTLYATFEILGANSKKIVPAKVVITESRYKSAIEHQLSEHGLTYIVVDLVDSARKMDLSGSAGRCQLPCPVCGKDDLDLSNGCANPSKLSPAVGDWFCNIFDFSEVQS